MATLRIPPKNTKVSPEFHNHVSYFKFVFTNPKFAKFPPRMAPPCKNIKYKEQKTWKPVVKIKKQSPPTRTTESPSTVSNYIEQVYFGGEDDIELEPVPPPIRNPVGGLREWVKKQRFIPQDLSDDFLLFFLSACGYDIELAKEKLEKYFDSRREPSMLFRDRDPLSSKNMNIFNKLYVLPMPDTTDDGRKIILTGLLQPTAEYDQMEHIKALTTVFDLLIWEKDFGFGDFEIVLDGRGFECPQLLQNKVYDHRSIRSLLLDTIPGTLRSLYLLYPPPHIANVADSRNGIWMTVVKSKQEMIKYLPPDILPLEFGGNLGHLGDLLEQWDMHMIQSRDFFIHFEKRMMNDYRRKICHEYDISKGKNWVQQMQLVDNWGYKNEYYEKMRTMKPFQHPAFGPNRLQNKPKEKGAVTVKNACMKRAKEEEENDIFKPTPFYNGYAKEIRRAKLEAQIELALQCCAQNPILELQFVYH